MQRKRITRTRIPLENLDESMLETIKRVGGRFLVIVIDEPCLTCGHRTRVQFIERTDGKRELIQECLFCLCSYHTEANRGAP